MSEYPPSSHIFCYSRQTNQSHVRTRVSMYFPSYSTRLETSKPRIRVRVRVRVDRPTRTLHHSAPKNPTKPPATNSRPPVPRPPPLPKPNPSTPPPQTHTSISGGLTPHHHAGEPLRSSVRQDLRPCVAEPPLSEFAVR
ncbi:uncharacterized protein M6B38_390850 [Iris pallida]|uniref:Uncharacterized protein n=1 Tax=Iris pallida TaxID=29817 RepID=A0AAX6FZF7_IRIPA|nr:uncharacterized protein M6B38_390850 [Iris pallida]